MLNKYSSNFVYIKFNFYFLNFYDDLFGKLKLLDFYVLLNIIIKGIGLY